MSKFKIAIIGGSGIDDPKILKNAEEINVDTPYGKTASPLVCGKINNIDIVTLARHGKGHTIQPHQVPFQANVWALKQVGCTHVLATTACGSMQEKIKPGDLVFLDQFIDFTKHRNLTFFDNEVVHTSMAEPFCPDLRNALAESAKKLNLSHHKQGNIITIEGPRFSTKAESKFFKQIGADVINMSTVPEVILARELGMCYASVAMSTDYDVWREGEETVTWEIILKVMKTNADNVKKLLLDIISNYNFSNCEQCSNS